jgi:AraC family transcriptional regulator of adaptative response / DNA-3-methyladenine glycosylase II
VVDDFERCYRAVQSRDSRFDGWFFIAVATTGIYCRPSCPATTPKRRNVSFHPSAAACQAAGFRACRRCRPDASPGSPEWNSRADVVGRAMRLIADGIVDREGVAGLAGALGYSARHLHRQLVAEVGAGPIALARSQRAHTARLLLETTELPCGDVAFAAGFSSIRQFNDTVGAVFAMSPTRLRQSSPKALRPRPGSPLGEIRLRLPYRPPFHGAGLLEFLGQRAVDGVEHWDGKVYRRTLGLPHGGAVMALSDGPGHVDCRLWLSDLRDLATAVQRARRLLDLDADPVAVAEQLGADPLLGPAVAAVPGRRIPGSVDGAELAVRAVLGQQVTVTAGRRLASVLTARHGSDLPGRLEHGPSGRPPHGASARHGSDLPGRLEHGPSAPDWSDRRPGRLFPGPAVIAALDPSTMGMPVARGRALVGLAAALADGRIVIDAGADREEVVRRLVAQPGIGPWTAAYVALRGLGDPDAFLASDLGVRRALARAGLAAGPAAASRRAQQWRPWRGYALQYLWAA